MQKPLTENIEKATKLLVVVEGKKDKRALEQLGFRNIFVINETGKSLNEKIEQLSEICNKNSKKTKVCILTDFDKRGRKLYAKLKTELLSLGVKLDNRFRSILASNGVSHIEGLASYVENLG